MSVTRTVPSPIVTIAARSARVLEARFDFASIEWDGGRPVWRDLAVERPRQPVRVGVAADVGLDHKCSVSEDTEQRLELAAHVERGESFPFRVRRLRAHRGRINVVRSIEKLRGELALDHQPTMQPHDASPNLPKPVRTLSSGAYEGQTIRSAAEQSHVVTVRVPLGRRFETAQRGRPVHVLTQAGHVLLVPAVADGHA